jgi:hypothetical protein
MFWLEEVLHAPTQDIEDNTRDEEDHVTGFQEAVGGEDAAASQGC